MSLLLKASPPKIYATTIYSSSGTWPIPFGVGAGNILTVETWGAGSGGGGRSAGGNFGAAGAGGAYAVSNYTVTPNDVLNGIAYSIGTGTVGISQSNPAAGGNTNWSNNNTNLIPTSITSGCVVGTPGTQPAGWLTSVGGLSQSVIAFGCDATGGSYVDIRINGTTTGTQLQFFANSASPTISIGSTYTGSFYAAIVGGTQTNISSVKLAVDAYNGSAVYISTPITPAITLTSTLTRFTGSAAAPALTVTMLLKVLMTCSSGVAVDLTLRLGGVQLEQAASVSAWKSTPGYTLALGGAAPSGTTGGAGTSVGSIGTIATNPGGSGANYGVNGSGGGGAGGKDGAGLDGSNVDEWSVDFSTGFGAPAGSGGNGDSIFGGLWGTVSTTTPGHPGTANNEGGGGGGGLTTVAGTAGAGGVPGGGGGGAVVSPGVGGPGADGQIRLSYTYGPVISIGPSGGVLGSAASTSPNANVRANQAVVTTITILA